MTSLLRLHQKVIEVDAPPALVEPVRVVGERVLGAEGLVADLAVVIQTTDVDVQKVTPGKRLESSSAYHAQISSL